VVVTKAVPSPPGIVPLFRSMWPRCVSQCRPHSGERGRRCHGTHPHHHTG
jgi:hypothetical protein